MEMKQALWNLTIHFPVEISSANGNRARTNLPHVERYSWQDVEEMYHAKKKQQKDTDVNEQECPAPTDNDEGSCLVSDVKYGNNNLDENEDPNMDDPFSVVQSFMRERDHVRSLDWLYENGYCQDHLRPGNSTLPQAGRGAFAAQFLPARTIVGFAPLIHIGIYGRDLWTIDYNNVGGVPGFAKRYDLVINYSFGHDNSTVLLTPYGGMVNYINHNSQSPNVRVQWPKKEMVSHKPTWLQKDPVFLKNTREKVGLSLEYVALRDIQEGEEIFMDYGPEWEEAWNDHVESWEPLPNAQQYQLAKEVDEPYFRTIHELGKRPYPHNVATMCLRSYTGMFGSDKEDSSNRSKSNRPTFKWLAPLKPIKDITERYFCVVAERHLIKREERRPGNATMAHGNDDDDEDLFAYEYTVDLKINDTESKDSWVRVLHMPGEGIGLYDLAYTGDWHMPNVFRRHIGIPNEIMPNAWINRLSSSSSSSSK
eukprot:CAMPEP_0172448548 /NCGR_PEP_ID=MMETSP1065-20121228/7551_1 /TAXON_ID=265537 /ORGANISM="Amphiprora paludosa, Strain CCMP125" /LENGTH=479 /DNA_ID=CAMNT_0013200091 /DNA_START=105 /DNA_END=1541 /DNA_ORIENTATION=+